MESEREVSPPSRTSSKKAVRNLWKRSSAAHKRFVILFIVLGAGLRATQFFEPVTYEETHAYLRFVARPVAAIISDHAHPLNNVLHTLLVKLCTSLFGAGVVQMRLPAFIAGSAALPLVYMFSRAMFNRYIALMTLALCAASGPLIQYSAISSGISLSWAFFVLALLLGRQLAKTNATRPAILLALVLALGFLTTPIMVYPAAMVFIWLLIYILSRYDTTANKRLGRLLLAAILFFAFSFVLYSPAVFSHGVAQLFYHPTMGDNSWETFTHAQHSASVEVWLWVSATTTLTATLLGVGALLFAVYVSTKYRVLMFALGLGCVPLVMLHRIVGPPQQWAWMLFLFYLGAAIALFYLLKTVQARLWPTFTKRKRTTLASLVLFSFFAWKALAVLPGMTVRYGDARMAARFLAGTMDQNDRVLAEHPWAPPLTFYLLVEGVDPIVSERDPVAPCTLHILVSPGDGQTPESVLLHNKQPGHHSSTAQRVKHWKRLELYTSRLED